MSKYCAVFVFLFLTGCGNQIVFEPNKLPEAQGVITISIKGGVVASAGQDFKRKYEINVLK